MWKLLFFLLIVFLTNVFVFGNEKNLAVILPEDMHLSDRHALFPDDNSHAFIVYIVNKTDGQIKIELPNSKENSFKSGFEDIESQLNKSYKISKNHLLRILIPNGLAVQGTDRYGCSLIFKAKKNDSELEMITLIRNLHATAGFNSLFECSYFMSHYNNEDWIHEWMKNNHSMLPLWESKREYITSYLINVSNPYTHYFDGGKESRSNFYVLTYICKVSENSKIGINPTEFYRPDVKIEPIQTGYVVFVVTDQNKQLQEKFPIFSL